LTSVVSTARQSVIPLPFLKPNWVPDNILDFSRDLAVSRNQQKLGPCPVSGS
jgi:hypothetical protein